MWALLTLRWRGGEQSNVEAWVRKLRCLCFLCSCLGFQTAMEPLRKLDMAEDEGAEASKRYCLPRLSFASWSLLKCLGFVLLLPLGLMVEKDPAYSCRKP